MTEKGMLQKDTDGKDRKSKAFLAGAVLLFAVLFILGCRTSLRKGVEIGDAYFYRINNELFKANDNNYLEILKQDETESARIVLNGEEQTAELIWDGNDVEITFSDGTVINGTWGNGELYDREGMPVVYSEEYLPDGMNADFTEMRKAVISDALCKVSRKAAQTRGTVWLMVLGAVFYIWGVLIIRYPEGSFFFLNRWRYRDAQLSDAGKTVEQIGGAVILLAGAVFLSGIYLLV